MKGLLMTYLSNPNSHRHSIYQSRCNRIFGTLIVMCVWLQIWNVLYFYQEISFLKMILCTVITWMIAVAIIGGLFVINAIWDIMIDWFMGY